MNKSTLYTVKGGIHNHHLASIHISNPLQLTLGVLCIERTVFMQTIWNEGAALYLHKSLNIVKIRPTNDQLTVEPPNSTIPVLLDTELTITS